MIFLIKYAHLHHLDSNHRPQASRIPSLPPNHTCTCDSQDMVFFMLILKLIVGAGDATTRPTNIFLTYYEKSFNSLKIAKYFLKI